MKNTGYCFISLVGGLVVGAALAMLFTPQSGPEFRASVKDFVDKEMDKMRCNCNDKTE